MSSPELTFDNIKSVLDKALRDITTTTGACGGLLPVPEVLTIIAGYATPYRAIVTTLPLQDCTVGGTGLQYPTGLCVVLPPLPLPLPLPAAQAQAPDEKSKTPASAESAAPEQWVVVIETLRHRILRYCLNDGRLIPFCGLQAPAQAVSFSPPYSCSTAFESGFRFPAAVVIDPVAPATYKGRCYFIADSTSVRYFNEITGTVTLIAGSDTAKPISGGVDRFRRSAEEVEFQTLAGMVVNRSGDTIWCSDHHNKNLWKVSIVRTVPPPPAKTASAVNQSVVMTVPALKNACPVLSEWTFVTRLGSMSWDHDQSGVWGTCQMDGLSDGIIHIDLSPVHKDFDTQSTQEHPQLPKAVIDRTLQYTSAVNHVMATANGEILFSVRNRRAIYVYDTRSNQPFFGEHIRLVAGSGDSRRKDGAGSGASFVEPGSMCFVGADDSVSGGSTGSGGGGLQQNRWLLVGDTNGKQSCIRRVSVDGGWFPLRHCCERDH